jgi:hypothetical protein
MRRATSAFLVGLRAPLRLVALARGTPAWLAYRRLVFRQLLASVVIMWFVAPALLGGLDLAARNPHTDIHIHGAHIVIVKKRTQLQVRASPDGEEPDADNGEEPIKVTGSSFLRAHAPSLLPLWIGVVAIYGAWIIVEWLVGALSHEHLDAVSDALTAGVGLPPPPPPSRPPRVRVDLRWMARRLWRQVLSAFVLASGAPLFLAARAVPGLGPYLYAGTLTAWGLYWLLVTTAAKSDLAWQHLPGRLPWFLRGWTTLTTRVPGFRWFLPRLYGRLWDRVTNKLHGAAELLEAAPFEFAGLAVVRVAANLPILGLLLRPLVPVAATLVSSPAGQNLGATDAA